MKEYHKIQTVYLRDADNNYRTLLDQFAKPEFELLKNINWICTEKIDGTNIRVIWDGINVEFKGKTDRAEIPKHLLKVLQETFTNIKMKICFLDADNVCLYGEGYGKKIQKGGNYLTDKADFILFDINIGDLWLKRYDIENIAFVLKIKIVPILLKTSLIKAIEYVKKGFISTISENKEYIAEGLVMKPEFELFNRRGERVITKIKYKDFQR